jgi:hypothetical protein
MWAIAEARPDDVVSGFLPRKSVDIAVAKKFPWVQTKRFLWAQCMMFPVALGDTCCEWVATGEDKYAAEWGNSGDMRIATWLKVAKRPVYVAVPHPVEHIGDALPGRSVMGHNGTPKGRRARAWLGEQGKGAEVPWNDLRFVKE